MIEVTGAVTMAAVGPKEGTAVTGLKAVTVDGTMGTSGAAATASGAVRLISGAVMADATGAVTIEASGGVTIGATGAAPTVGPTNRCVNCTPTPPPIAGPENPTGTTCPSGHCVV